MVKLKKEEEEEEENLAAQRAEAKGIKKASATNLASVGDTLTRPGLRPLVQEHNLRAVYYVCLHA